MSQIVRAFGSATSPPRIALRNDGRGGSRREKYLDVRQSKMRSGASDGAEEPEAPCDRAACQCDMRH